MAKGPHFQKAKGRRGKDAELRNGGGARRERVFRNVE